MNSADKIKRLFNNAELSVDPNTDEKMFDDVLQARQTVTKKVSAMPEIWRITMKNPVIKLAVAAVVIIACVIGFSLWTGTGSGIVLANVLTQIEKIGAYKYQMDMTSTGSHTVGNTTIDINQVLTGYMIMSQEYGMKMKMDILNADNQETSSEEAYLLVKEKALITLSHNRKSYTRMEIDDTQIDRIKNQNYDPGKMVEQFLTSEYKSLGISTIDGIEVEGFETNDTKIAGGLFSQVDIKLWVDVKTQLPFLMEMDVQMKEPMNITISGVINNFQWNVPVDASEFEPIIPDDYTSATSGSIKMPAYNEETAIKGLQLFADLIGRYPEELNLTILTSHIREITRGDTPAAKQFQEELEGLNIEERSQRRMETIMPIQGAGMFYMQLVQDNKDPAYYGNIVTPEDAGLVLMRWKVSESEYRVIFGNLQAETVDADVLAELESTLPQ